MTQVGGRSLVRVGLRERLVFQNLYVYLRSALVAVVALAVVIVLFKNRNNQVVFWFFGLTDPTRPVNVVWLVLSISGTTMLVWRVAAVGVRLWKDWSELKADLAIREAAKAQGLRESKLAEREQALERKLQRVIGAGEPAEATDPKADDTK